MITFELLSGNLPWHREIEPLVLLDHIKHHDIDVHKQLDHFRDINQRDFDGAELKRYFYHVAKEERNQDQSC